MKEKDFIAVRFPNDSKQYFAEIKSIGSNDRFTCRFVHTGSNYTFEQHSGWLEVKETNGNFPPGTRTNDVIHYEPKQHNNGKGENVAVTFEDGYAYLGTIESTQPDWSVRFLHSGNVYTIDANGVAHLPGKLYDGKRVLEKKAFSRGNNLFHPTTEKILVLEITGKKGPLRGEFEAKINVDTGDPLAANLYENAYLRAEEGKAQDRLEVNGHDQQLMTIFVSFHPSLLPYDINPRESSGIDRSTSIYGKKSFPYKKDAASLHFDIDMIYDSTTVSNTTKEEAIKTIMKEHRKGSSSTKGYEFGTEAKGDILVVEASGSFTHTRESTESDETTTGESESTGTGTESTNSWTVYYPIGLEIKERF